MLTGKVLGGGFDDHEVGQRGMGMGMRFGMSGAVRAARAAGLGAGTERFVHNCLDGPRAATALGAAAEATIDLPRRARRTRSANGISDIMVGEDVAGTNDHRMKAGSQGGTPLRYLRAGRDAKGKHPF
jgi:hypothetical protein